MGFEEEIDSLGRESKGHHRGHEGAIEKVVTDFKARRRSGEFEGWDQYMVQEDFLRAVGRLFPKKIKARPEGQRKQSRKRMSK